MKYATVLALVLFVDKCGPAERAARPGRAWQPAAVQDARPLASRPRARARPDKPCERSFSWIVAADTHLGYPGMAALNRRQVRAMNLLPGRSMPRAMGGRVDRPLGVLVLGDLTERGTLAEWRLFLRFYGPSGAGGMLDHPLYLTIGNHDRTRGRGLVPRMVRRRHGRLNYTWQWHGVRFIGLDVFPRRSNRRWLRRTLGARSMPTVIVFHYNLQGPFSNFWSRRDKQAFRDDIRGHRVIAIFHGHFHPAEHYRWAGVDVFNVGSPKYDHHSFAVVRLSPHRMEVAYWNWWAARWQWWLRRDLARGADARSLGCPAAGVPPLRAP